MASRIPLPSRSLFSSPLLVKETRSIMRGWRTFAAMTLFLLFLAAAALLVLVVELRAMVGMGSGIGDAMFVTVAGLESLLLLVMTPALTASAIASERQQKTFDMLMATPLSPRQVLWGKLSAAFSYLLLLIVAAVPINMLSLIFGGMSVGQVALWQVLLLAALFLTAIVGLWWSTVLARSTTMATVMTFLTGLMVLGVLPIAYFIILMASFRGDPPACAFFAPFFLHPLAGGVALMNLVTEVPQQSVLLLAALYVSVALLLFVLAEWRLRRLAGQRWRGAVLMLGSIVAVAATLAAYLLYAAPRFCSGMGFS